MNSSERARFEQDLGALLQYSGRVAFNCNLAKVFDLPSYNLSRRAVVAEISDMFTGTAFIKKHGDWAVSEIEGPIALFAPVGLRSIWVDECGQRVHGDRKWSSL